MSQIQPIDLVAATVLGIAALRGVFLGLIREAFSIAALAAGVVAVRVWNEPTAAWLFDVTDGWISAAVAPWVAGALLAVTAIAVVGFAGSMTRKGARAAGLGWADRAAGAALGLAEGAIVAGVLLLVLAATIGRGHQILAGSRTLAALERIERVAGERQYHVRDVAAPAPAPRS
jgi:membrane protein required for colicin V production